MRTILLAILLNCFALSIQAQNATTYNQTWISGAYQKNYKKWNFKVDGSYRSIEWFKYNRQFLIREISTYTIDNWKLGIGPCLSWQYPYYSPKPVMEIRPTFQVSYNLLKKTKSKFESNKADLTLRLRTELRYFKTNASYSGAYIRPRLALRSSFPIHEHLSFQPHLEAMWQQDPGNQMKFSVGRIYVGFNYKVKKINIQFGFMLQYLERGNQDELDNNYILTINN